MLHTKVAKYAHIVLIFANKFITAVIGIFFCAIHFELPCINEKSQMEQHMRRCNYFKIKRKR